MRNFTILTLFLSFVLLSSSCEIDELLNVEDGGVYGVVKDARTGNPIPAAVVHINGPESLTATTNNNGNYRFEDLEPGTYTVSAEADRYQTPFEDVTVVMNNFVQKDIEMEYESMLSTHILDFGTEEDELEIVITNLLNESIDIKVEENESWLFTRGATFALEPGESDVLTVEINRFAISSGITTTSFVVNIEEDFDFDVLESYVVDVRVEN